MSTSRNRSGASTCGKVPRSLNDLKAAAGNDFVSRVGVADRNDGVAISPYDEGRDLPGQIQAVQGTHRLAARIDDGAKSTDKGLSVGGFGE